MPTPILWPELLCPARIEANPAPFTRSSGRTLGGLRRAVKTDRGYWSIVYKGVPLYGADRRRMLAALQVAAGGSAGLIAVPVWTLDSADWLPGSVWGRYYTLYGDDTLHSDDTPHVQPALGLTMQAEAAIGATSVTLTLGAGMTEAAGIRFSYAHALYQTGFPTLISGANWTVPIFPSIRATIPAAAELEAGLPTCLVRLANDRELDAALSSGRFDTFDVAFQEAADYWSDLAE